eukprot:TRINITY_DN31618_c0_g1_i1.p1 TRINITY_DN31618_c0_g1~~TRINITY_DN31618_c0_g1_i1.p1  ORF type:complete len:256 (+),score=42.33 TRINITY_DN31618_c0_g1_i1:41-769(+)
MAIDMAVLLREALDNMDNNTEGEHERTEEKKNENPARVTHRQGLPVGVTLPKGWQERCKIGPENNLWVIENAVSAAGEEELAKYVDHCGTQGKWVELKGRMVMEFTSDGLPSWLDGLMAAFKGAEAWGAASCNHVLINKYPPGGGILPHTDGPAYVPCTVTLSLLQPAFFRLAPRMGCQGSSFSVLLQPRTLVVFSDDIYSQHTHEILPDTDTIPSDCINAPPGTPCLRTGDRVSLTFRHML